MDVRSLYFSDSDKHKIVDSNYDNSKMSKSDFMKVLLAQLQWQDPLEAENIDDMINNSVKLREMEVLNSFESNVESMVDSMKALSLFYASGFIGKKIIYKGSKVITTNGKTQFSFKLDSPAKKVTILIMDKNGNTVDKKIFYDLTAGEYPLELTLSNGVYSVNVEAETYDGEKKNLEIESKAKVLAVKKSGNSIILDTEVGELPMENIIGLGG